jgi:hexosaminidase
VGGLIVVGATHGAAAGPALIPAPQQAKWAGGRLALRDGVKIFPVTGNARSIEIAEILRDGLREQAGVAADLGGREGVGSSVVVRFELQPAAAPDESYQLAVGDGVTIRANDVRGLLWGAQTLLQAIDPGDGNPSVPKGEVADRPARAWRGLMLDPVRAWLDLDFVWRTIRVMSAYKLNVLHLHLIDDHAWRFESKAWPKANRAGEPRYSQAELQELVRFAARYGVEVVPEFDVPGHSMTAVNAYPELDCERKPRAMNEAIFCAGKAFTHEFIDKLVAESARIFPSKFIHLGADEPYAIKRWATCPDCQAKMKERGVTTVESLYHTFVADLNEIVKRHGRTLVVWNDAIHPGVEPMPPKDIIIDGWVGFESVGPLAQAGYTMLNSSSGPLYLTSFGLREGLPLAAVLAWDATKFAHPRAKRGDTTLKYEPLDPTAKILGGHASAWATEQRLTERRLYPRLQAFAEDLWSEGKPHAAPEFQARFEAGHLARLRKLGVPDDDALPVEKIPVGNAKSFASPRAYRDFALTFEVKRGGIDDDTGVKVRAGPQGGFTIRAAPPPGWVMSKGLVTANGWNRCEVVARGPVITLTVNGGLAWSVVDPAPRAGNIVFSVADEAHQFRNIEVRKLDDSR